MMLPRKRQRPNPAALAAASASGSASPTPRPHATSSTSLLATASEPTLPEHQMPPKSTSSSGQDSSKRSDQSDIKQVRKSKSWYGSWPRAPKATPSTSVARENIFGGSVKSSKAPDLTRFDSKKDSDSSSLRSTTKSTAGLTKIPENGSTEMTADDSSHSPAAKPDNPDINTQPDAAPPLTQPTIDTTPQRPASSPGWWGWISSTPFTETQFSTPLPPSTEDRPDETETTMPKTPPDQTAPVDPSISEASYDPPPSTSWFDFWSSRTQPSKIEDAPDGQPSTNEPAKEPEDIVMDDAPPQAPQKPEPAPKAGSTWAFWSKDSPKAKGPVSDGEAGEIAVIGEGSEAHPKPMTEDNMSGTPSNDPKAEPNQKNVQPASKSTWRKTNKRIRPPSMDIDTPATLSPSPSGTSTPQGSAQADSSTQPKVDSSSKSIAESEKTTKAQPNLLLPSFTSTYQMKENPSIIKQVAQFLLRTQQPPANHVYRVKDPPKIRKAIAIGVHGLFPATYLRPMIGQPTGTSLRFVSLCAEAIRKWADEHGCSDCEIEKVALEGEGKISDRVDNLWKLMLNWIEHIRSADLIIMACHSQGVPVSIMLLEKLIDLGIITNARIGVCAMAGVSLGPFPDYKSGIFTGSAAELWEFGNPQSNNSQRLEAALKRVLDYGARITFIGSIDDQVVPMESAVYSPAHHPNIYRAVFIDGRVHAPDFIAHLVGFALKLRNLGISDHGLIRELSVPLAGSLYSGEGHSRIYYETAVYDLAVSHALETTSAPGGPNARPCEIRRPQGSEAAGVVSGSGGQPNNPYLLPWIMRGLLEEDFVKTELSSETDVLLKQFDDWKPTNKALKDVKYRLEAVRSKL